MCENQEAESISEAGQVAGTGLVGMATLGSKQVVEADPSVHDQVSVAASQQVGTMNKLLDPDPEI